MTATLESVTALRQRAYTSMWRTRSDAWGVVADTAKRLLGSSTPVPAHPALQAELTGALDVLAVLERYWARPGADGIAEVRAWCRAEEYAGVLPVARAAVHPANGDRPAFQVLVVDESPDAADLDDLMRQARRPEDRFVYDLVVVPSFEDALLAVLLNADIQACRLLLVTVDRPRWLQMIRDKQRPVATAAVAALRDVAASSVQEGRRDIAGSGRFTGGWVSRLQYRTSGATEGGEPSLQASAVVFHTIGLAGIFEHGATISGKPLLWIPTRRGDPPAGSSGKKLTSATVRGTPMSFDADEKNRQRKPLYIGVPSVRVPKKWHITEIVKKHVAQIAQAFLRHFKDT